ncbi:hypothetical protein TRFO_41580 [Tritrichomonas foetus]|uniref:Translation initiation factor beta propellor-like domain-containing protein n=1 Tax=Tritrichomonas foetus TaxID=1144522 RepID=A0A1J4L105_9EUKA|nr:hypothetical protein TRFO_41580 [Tritrichomonas foetus]|eukprot:OHT16768.1 hypothetical protein TRFO_41580 [Tritrichomonas foetus]
MFICTGSVKGIELRRVEYENGNLKLNAPIQVVDNCRNFTFSPKFNFVAFYTKSGIQSTEFPDKFVQICMFNPQNGTITQIQQVPVPNITNVIFSPNGTFFALILRRNSFTEEQKIPLVQIYRTGGQLIRSFDYALSKIPEIFWSDDERVFASSHSHGINFYKTEDDGSVTESNIELPNLLACAFVCDHGRLRFAVVYNDKTTEAKRMKLFEYPNLERHIATRPVMIGESFTVKISPNGSSAIAIGLKNQSDETYFGESFAYYLNVQGQMKLPLKKSGPIHYIEYSKGGDRFVTIAGHVPPSISIHYDKVGTAFEIGQYSFNSVRFAPGNQLVALGGFGNFNGNLKTFDTQTRTSIADGEALYTSEWEWSPCGRLFFSAVLYPKMMVSNEFRVHNHACQILQTVKVEELTQCGWVGLSQPLPLPKVNLPAAVNKAPSAYVPPHLRAKMAAQAPPAQAPTSNPKFPPGYKK